MTCLEEYDERTYPRNKGRALCMRNQPSWAPRGFGRLAWSAGAVDCPSCLRAHVTRLESDLDCAVGMLRERKRRLGIGAVVAMVAAARMVASGWRPRDVDGDGLAHWDWVPRHISLERAAACGAIAEGGDYTVSGIEFVDCPDCLAIHGRATEVSR